MPTDELIETVALALGPRNGCDATHSGCENRDVRGGCACRDDARAVLSVVAEAMREPTKEMDRAGSAEDRHYWPGSRFAHWAAMFAASPLGGE